MRAKETYDVDGRDLADRPIGGLSGTASLFGDSLMCGWLGNSQLLREVIVAEYSVPRQRRNSNAAKVLKGPTTLPLWQRPPCDIPRLAADRRILRKARKQEDTS
jgi:hypothetical protein